MKMLMLAGLAFAAATPAVAQMAPGTMTEPKTAPAPAPTPPMSDPAMTPPAAPTDTPMAAPTAPPTGTAPMSPTMPMADSAAPASSGTYPMCSRTVTDSCTERSNGRGERMRSTPRKR